MEKKCVIAKLNIISEASSTFSNKKNKGRAVIYITKSCYSYSIFLPEAGHRKCFLMKFQVHGKYRNHHYLI